MTSLVPDAEMLVLQGHGHCSFLAHSVDIDAILADWPPTARSPSPPAR